MKSTLYLAAALAAGLSGQVLAADQAVTPAPAAPATSVEAAKLTADASAQTVRQLLLSQGYSNISELNLDDKGRWAGTAVKNGKTVGVAMALPKKETATKTN